MTRSVFIAYLVLAGCTQSKPDIAQTDVSKAATSVISSAAIEAATNAIRSEPKVIDLTYNASNVFQWTVGVADDGSRRDGYAAYICSIINQAKARDDRTSVRIVDYSKFQNLNGDARASELGNAVCSE